MVAAAPETETVLASTPPNTRTGKILLIFKRRIP
jgi:hypothetical protein